MSSNFTVKKVCEQCGQIFLAKTTVTRFCSKPCNSKNYKQQIRNEKIGKSNEVVHTGISHQLQELTSLEFLSVKATAKLLGASDKIVYNMIRSGRLKATNLSARKTVISRKDIDSLFELPAATNEDPADLANCYHMGETQAIYNISEKALYDIIKRNNITKIQSGKFTYVAKSALDKIFNNMARVTIRKKGISKNRHCIYLDYYPPVRNPKTGKLHRFEFLKVYLFDKPGSALERKHNQETMELVENVRAHRQLDIQNEKFGFISSDMRRAISWNFSKLISTARRVRNVITWLCLTVTLSNLPAMCYISMNSQISCVKTISIIS